jgi:hypothetical protein
LEQLINMTPPYHARLSIYYNITSFML